LAFINKLSARPNIKTIKYKRKIPLNEKYNARNALADFDSRYK